MAIATLFSRGRITVPREIREVLRLTTGDRIEFHHLGNGVLAVRPIVRPQEGLDDSAPIPAKRVSSQVTVRGKRARI